MIEQITLKVEVSGLEVIFGHKTPVTAVRDLSLSVRPREFVSLLGVSGCGKSTVLNCVAGFVPPTRGSVRVDGRVVSGPRLSVGFVFQAFVLFPWKTVRQNIEFGPRLRHLARSRVRAMSDRYLKLMGLSNFANRYPQELSGGMQQRVALARILINDPDVLLMDEPFGSLDYQTRIFMQELLMKLWERTDKSVLFVTHDIDEAILLSDRVYVMTASPGQIKADVAIEIERPRTHDTFLDPVFLRYKRILEALISEETRKVLGTLPLEE